MEKNNYCKLEKLMRDHKSSDESYHISINIDDKLEDDFGEMFLEDIFGNNKTDNIKSLDEASEEEYSMSTDAIENTDKEKYSKKDKSILRSYDNLLTTQVLKDINEPVAVFVGNSHIKNDTRDNNISNFIETEAKKDRIYEDIDKMPVGFSEYSKVRDKKIKPYILAQYILENVAFRYYSKRLYMYHDATGDFQYIDDHDAHVLIMSSLSDKVKKKVNRHTIDQVLYFIKTDIQTQLDTVDVFTKNSNLINFKNGVLDLETLSFFNHSPDYNFFYHLNAKYKSEKGYKRTKFKNYIDTVTNGNKDLEYILQEVFGYCISTFNCAKKAFIMSGLPNSGKSLFLNLLKEIVGQTNCSFVELQRLSERFQTAQLHGKLLNINAELGDESIKDTGMFKALTGQDIINAERKGEHPFDFINHARLIFACNELPNIKKVVNSKAFFDRLIIVPFNYSIATEKQDKNLLNKLCDEKPAIINWALEGLERLIDNNFIFSKSNLVEDMRNLYIRSNNNVIDFIEEYCILKNEYRIHISELYSKYCSYCKDNELTILKQNQFCLAISNTYHLKKSRFRVSGQSLWGLEGITIKEKVI